MEQWCRTSLVYAGGLDEVLTRMTSRRQFARPAVVFKVLDQTSFIPPVASESLVILLEQMVASSSFKKDVAMSSLRSAKSFLCIRASFVASSATPPHGFSLDCARPVLFLDFEMGLADSSPELLRLSEA